MRHITIIISILLLTCCDHSLFGQGNSVEKSSIDNYIKHIDSLIDQDDNQVFVIRSIAEGRISHETVMPQHVSRKNKVDTIRKKIYGGWSRYSYANGNSDTVYKIKYHDNLQKNFYLIFYYRDNLLVCSKLDYQQNGIGQTFYKKEEYYKNEQVIYVVETTDKIDEVYKRRASIDLYAKGCEYYKVFLKDK